MFTLLNRRPKQPLDLVPMKMFIKHCPPPPKKAPSDARDNIYTELLPLGADRDRADSKKSHRQSASKQLGKISTTVMTSTNMCFFFVIVMALSHIRSNAHILKSYYSASSAIKGSGSDNTLTNLINHTNNGELIEFALKQISRLNPALVKRGNIKVGTPSLARDKSNLRTILGFRIETPTVITEEGVNKEGLFNSNFLMLCELKNTMDSIVCQDSGIFPWHIPPQCNPHNWLNPVQRTFWGFLTNGPEDARLFFDAGGALWTIFGSRGCHEKTPFNSTNPIYSLYFLKWDEQHTEDGPLWVPNSIPSLLDLRNKDGQSLGDEYPSVTKSWIPIPPATVSNSAEEVNLHLLVGFTRNMASSVVYEIFQHRDSTSFVKPYGNSPEISEADTGSFRGSTNLISFHSYLLGVGHPAKKSKYFLYW